MFEFNHALSRSIEKPFPSPIRPFTPTAQIRSLLFSSTPIFRVTSPTKHSKRIPGKELQFAKCPKVTRPGKLIW